MSSAERSYSSASSQEVEARQSHLPQPDHRPAETPGAQAAATAAPAHQPVADTALADDSKEPRKQPEDALTDAPATPEAHAEPARSQGGPPASEASAAHRAAEEAGPQEEAAAVKPAAAWGAASGGGAWGQKKSFAQILAADAGGRASLAPRKRAPPARPLTQVGRSEHRGITNATASNEWGSPAGSGTPGCVMRADGLGVCVPGALSSGRRPEQAQRGQQGSARQPRPGPCISAQSAATSAESSRSGRAAASPKAVK